jgi:hypothetical protein
MGVYRSMRSEPESGEREREAARRARLRPYRRDDLGARYEEIGRMLHAMIDHPQRFEPSSQIAA